MESFANKSEGPARCIALIPAAGQGSRMGPGSVPKQYLPVLGKPMIWHAVQVFCGMAAIDHVYVVLSPEDAEWPSAAFASIASRLTVLRCGGATRAESVANGLREVAKHCDAERTYVLVHDAARPCVTPQQVEALIPAAMSHPDGAILAVPVSDTLKRAADGPEPTIATTVSRELLWQAQTPQMFRIADLQRALARAASVTDESSAIEASGGHPRMVAGDPANLKVTYPQDLVMAELILSYRQSARGLS